MRAYGITNAVPYASAPAVGAAGDTYWNTTTKVLYVSDGAAWVAAGTGAGGPPTGAAGGDLGAPGSTYPNPTITDAAKSKWSVSGATLTPTDATKRLAVAAGLVAPADAMVIQSSGQTAQVHLGALGNGWALRYNNALAAGSTPDDTAKASWSVQVESNDTFNVYRAPATAGVPAYINLLRIDTTGLLTVPGDPATGNAFVDGTRTSKQRLIAHTSVDASFLAFNGRLTASAWAQDDAAKASWVLGLRNDSDIAAFYRIAPGATALTSLLTLDATGNLTITGATATKASGTTWANPSDRRLKDAIEDYATGLAAILQLQPRTFVYNGKGGSLAGMRGYGFIADEVAPVMPETVGVRAGKLEATDEDETDIQTLDASNIIWALVNAVKELAARVARLEGGVVPR